MKQIILFILIMILIFISKFTIREFFDLKFVHIPKNAGTSIENIALKNNIKWGFRDWTKKDKDNKLIKSSGGCFKKPGNWINRSTNNNVKYNSCYPWHMTPDELGRNIYNEDDELFGIVRNPYDKIVSAFKYRYGKNATKKELNKFIKDKLTNFEKNERWNGCHILPQHKYTHGNIKSDYILKFENLDNDFKNLIKNNENKNIKTINLQKNNKSGSKLNMNDLTQKSKDLIYKAYKKDFELFGYNK